MVPRRRRPASRARFRAERVRGKQRFMGRSGWVQGEGGSADRTQPGRNPEKNNRDCSRCRRRAARRLLTGVVALDARPTGRPSITRHMKAERPAHCARAARSWHRSLRHRSGTMASTIPGLYQATPDLARHPDPFVEIAPNPGPPRGAWHGADGVLVSAHRSLVRVSAGVLDDRLPIGGRLVPLDRDQVPARRKSELLEILVDTIRHINPGDVHGVCLKSFGADRRTRSCLRNDCRVCRRRDSRRSPLVRIAICCSSNQPLGCRA